MTHASQQHLDYARSAGLPMPHAVHAAVMVGAAVAIMAAGFFGWRIAGPIALARTPLLVALIVAGLGAALCLGGAMRFLDDALTPRAAVSPWWKLALAVKTRVLLLLQAACSAAAAGGAIALVFGYKLPGS